VTTFDLILVGYGNVARRFGEMLVERRETLAAGYGMRPRIIGVATRREGPRYVAKEFGHTRAADAAAFIREACARDDAAAREGRLVMIETTTLDIGRGEPAVTHVRTALAGGAHVVTANKGPAAFAYRQLARAAARAKRRFLFEGAVMDGVPIFNLAREALPAARVVGFRGVVNSTTNYILTAMEQGGAFDDALAEMQARGIAEADASLDVDGWDAAAKASALANVLLDAEMTPHEVERTGISPKTAALATEARAKGRRLKLVVRGGRVGGRVTARVSPESLPADDLLARLEGQQNALVLQTDVLGETAIVQMGGGLEQTAYALLSDLVTIASPTPRSPTPARRRRSPGRSGRR
jgi:homoserine dehydrogenase